MRIGEGVFAGLAAVAVGILVAVLAAASGQPVLVTLEHAAGWTAQMASAVGWPSAFLIALWWFRPQLKEKLADLIYSEGAGLKLRFREQQEKSQTALSTVVEPPRVSQTVIPEAIVATGNVALPAVRAAGQATVSNPPLPPASPEIEQLETRIDAQLGEVNESVRLIVLRRELAIARLQIGFEQTNNLIYGSQIRGLRELCIRGAVSIREAVEFFESIRQQYPQFHVHGFDVWIAYLLRNLLVRRDAERVQITDLGRAFVEYLDRFHPGEVKLW